MASFAPAVATARVSGTSFRPFTFGTGPSELSRMSAPVSELLATFVLEIAFVRIRMLTTLPHAYLGVTSVRGARRRLATWPFGGGQLANPVATA